MVLWYPKFCNLNPKFARLLLLDEYFASACDVVMRCELGDG